MPAGQSSAGAPRWTAPTGTTTSNTHPAVSQAARSAPRSLFAARTAYTVQFKRGGGQASASCGAAPSCLLAPANHHPSLRSGVCLNPQRALQRWEQQHNAPPAEQVCIHQVQPPRNVQRCYTCEHLARVRFVACSRQRSQRPQQKEEQTALQQRCLLQTPDRHQCHSTPGVQPKPPSKFLQAAT